VLTPLNIPMAVMGGIAVSVWQHARSTRDVDILIQLAPSDTSNIGQALGEAGIHPRRFQPLLSLDEQHVLMMYYHPPGAFFEIKIDLLYAELDSKNWRCNGACLFSYPAWKAPFSC
jgi:hypothetical protein